MVSEVFDDGEAPTPEQKAMLKALMNGGMLKLSRTPEGKVDIDVIPAHDLYPDPPKDPQ